MSEATVLLTVWTHLRKVAVTLVKCARARPPALENSNIKGVDFR